MIRVNSVAQLDVLIGLEGDGLETILSVSCNKTGLDDRMSEAKVWRESTGNPIRHYRFTDRLEIKDLTN